MNCCPKWKVFHGMGERDRGKPVAGAGTCAPGFLHSLTHSLTLSLSFLKSWLKCDLPREASAAVSPDTLFPLPA